MALPKLKTPTHTLELPSTGEKIKFRPFLVKEQKLLMMAQESGNEDELASVMSELIAECTFNAIDAETAPMFDVEYIFLQVRGKSVGETIELNVLCDDDGKTRVPVSLNIEDIFITGTAGLPVGGRAGRHHPCHRARCCAGTRHHAQPVPRSTGGRTNPATGYGCLRTGGGMAELLAAQGAATPAQHRCRFFGFHKSEEGKLGSGFR